MAYSRIRFEIQNSATMTLVQIELNGGLTYGPLLTGKSQFGEGLLSEASTEDEDWTIKTDEYVGVDDLPDVKEPEDVPY